MWTFIDREGDGNAAQVAVARIVNDVLTAAIATTSAQSGPWIFTAYVAFRGNRCWFTSQESTRHVAEIREASPVAVAMWAEPEAWGDPLLGLQLAGYASEVVTHEDAEVGLAALHEKFPGTQGTLPATGAVIGESKRTCLFMVECDRGSVRDEARIGKGRFPITWIADRS